MKLDVVTPDRIMQLGHAFQGAKTLLSAVELGVFSAPRPAAGDPYSITSLARSRKGIGPFHRLRSYSTYVIVGPTPAGGRMTWDLMMK